MPLIHPGKSQNHQIEQDPLPRLSQLITLVFGEACTKPSQKGCSCQASDDPVHSMCATTECTVLTTQLTSTLVNSFRHHKKHGQQRALK